MFEFHIQGVAAIRTPFWGQLIRSPCPFYMWNYMCHCCHVLSIAGHSAPTRGNSSDGSWRRLVSCGCPDCARPDCWHRHSEADGGFDWQRVRGFSVDCKTYFEQEGVSDRKHKVSPKDLLASYYIPKAVGYVGLDFVFQEDGDPSQDRPGCGQEKHRRRRVRRTRTPCSDSGPRSATVLITLRVDTEGRNKEENSAQCQKKSHGPNSKLK